MKSREAEAATPGAADNGHVTGLGQGWESFCRNRNMSHVCLERNVESARGDGRRPTCLEHKEQVGAGGGGWNVLHR